jgi:hypothetical protein
MIKLPKYRVLNYENAYQREVVSPKETQDQIIHRLLDLSILFSQALSLQAGGTIKKSTDSTQYQPAENTEYVKKDEFWLTTGELRTVTETYTYTQATGWTLTDVKIQDTEE